MPYATAPDALIDARGREGEIAALGARLATLRLCEPDAVADVQRTLERHGQLMPLVVLEDAGHLETLDGFKRLRAARAIGWTTLRVDVLAPGLGVVDAKLAFGALHARRGLTELEEAWLIRSLVRDDGLRQGDIAQRLPGTRAGSAGGSCWLSLSTARCKPTCAWVFSRRAPRWRWPRCRAATSYVPPRS